MFTLKTRQNLRDILLGVLDRLRIPYRIDPLRDSEGSSLLDSDGLDILGFFHEGGHLYFQPPPNVQMKYPAIVYELSNMPASHADNHPYVLHQQYTITAIDKDPDSRLPEELAAIPTSRMNRFFTSDGLNHWVFSIYL